MTDARNIVLADAAQRVAVLGTGIMGAPMARNLLKAGFHVRVWNRTVGKARALAAEGADLAETPERLDRGALREPPRPAEPRGLCDRREGSRLARRSSGASFR